MPTWMKVLLIVGVLLVLLVVGGVVALFMLARAYGPGLMEAGKQTYGEGVEYGRRTDNEGCLNEAVARHARTDGLGARIKNAVFMRACLGASRPTPGFCDDVPSRIKFMKSIGWQAQQCQRYGLSTEQQCGQLFSEVQQFCDQRRANPGDAGASGDVPPFPALQRGTEAFEPFVKPSGGRAFESRGVSGKPARRDLKVSADYPVLGGGDRPAAREFNRRALSLVMDEVTPHLEDTPDPEKAKHPLFILGEYQAVSYAGGEPKVLLPFDSLKEFINPRGALAKLAA